MNLLKKGDWWKRHAIRCISLRAPVADTIVVCMRNDEHGEMFITGREVNECRYPLTMNKLYMQWEMSAPNDQIIDTGSMLLINWFQTHETITAKELAIMCKMTQGFFRESRPGGACQEACSENKENQAFGNHVLSRKFCHKLGTLRLMETGVKHKHFGIVLQILRIFYQRSQVCTLALPCGSMFLPLRLKPC